MMRFAANPAAAALSRGASRVQTVQRARMCGLIAAIDDVFSPSAGSSATASASALLSDPHQFMYNATQVLRHRGPDGQHVDSGTIGPQAARWSMGHARLAIVDPANRQADMPFALEFQNGAKKIHLAANGEIYNHKSLYNDLVAKHGWKEQRTSASDCEVIGHAYAALGGPEAVKRLDGMFAFCIFEEDAQKGSVAAFAARDPVGIKPLYYGRGKDGGSYLFSSELKALVGHVEPSSVVAIPPGHYWTPETGLVRYHEPAWLYQDDFAPWKDPDHVAATDDEIRAAFTQAIEKRMMADVDYGFFLSGGVDSCVVSHALLPLYRAHQEISGGDDRPIPTFTVGMENSPDLMAAKGMVEALGGPRYVDHRIRTFTPDEVFDLIPKIVYHMETYEAELIRSAIPNWLLAERAGADVKMVLTGEGADELFAGYLYFQDAQSPDQLQRELRRIYSMLGNVNLHRTDRMTMAHGLEARVPFLDTKFTELVMSVDPARKMVDPAAVKANARGREKTLLRELFAGPNANGHSIPRPVLWRAKAMQCEGVGEDWVSILQRKIGTLVSDAELAEAATTYPVNTPQTKEELYYRRIYDEHYHGMEHVVKLWEGGGRAMGAEWKSEMYTREGLADVNLLTHAMQNSRMSSATEKKSGAMMQQQRSFSSKATSAARDAHAAATMAGFDDFESWLTTGGDDRSLILESGTNKYHIAPRPIDSAHVFRGSCTGNPPTERGYNAAKQLFEQKLKGLSGEKLESELRDIFADQRARLSALLDLPEGAEVVLVPSGSDAEYLPVAIARALHPTKKIVSAVTQLSEIGAGSAPAAVGEYFSTHAPLLGRVPSGTKKLDGFGTIPGVAIPARNDDGTAKDVETEMAKFRAANGGDDVFAIIHGVFGGKTGMRDQVMPQSDDQQLGVVDACQGRFSQAELRSWLEQESLVLFTGSKFYQAPPFCGAVIVPPGVAEKLRNSPPPEPASTFGVTGLGGFVTDKELPEFLDNWKPLLKQDDANNVGLALRWEAGLAGMEALANIPDAEREAAVNGWAELVAKMVDFEAELDAPYIERSIVSIRVAKNGGGYLSMSELRDLYRWMSMDVSQMVPDATPDEVKVLSKPAYIGQPVSVAKSHGIVRIALGVESLLSYMADPDSTLREDSATVLKLAAISRHFDTLSAAEKDKDAEAA